MIYRVIVSDAFRGELSTPTVLELRFRCFDLHAPTEEEAVEIVREAALDELDQGEARALIVKLIAPDATVYELQHGRPLPFPKAVELGEDGPAGPASPMDLGGLL